METTKKTCHCEEPKATWQSHWSKALVRLLRLACASLAMTTTMGYSQGGEVGKLLSFGAGARSLGLGRAYTAVVRDSTALYWNPAGLGNIERREITALHATLFEDTAYDYIGYGHPFLNGGAFGAEVVRLNTSGIEKRDNLNTLTGSISNTEMGIGIGGGFKRVLGTPLAMGGSVKMLNRQLGNDKNTLYGLDLGGQYEIGKRLRAGTMLYNVVSAKSGDTDDRMPFKVRIGLGYEIIRNAATIALDIENFKEFFVGTEYSLGIGSVRLGWQPEGLAVGGGIVIKDLKLDYAVTNHPELGWSQRMSVGYGFGDKLNSKRLELAGKLESTADKAVVRGQYAEAMAAYQEATRYEHGSDDDLTLKISRLEKLLTVCRRLAGESQAENMARKGVTNYLVKQDKEATFNLAYAHTLAPENKTIKQLYNKVQRDTDIEVKNLEAGGSQNFVEQRLSQSLLAFWNSSYDEVIKLCEEVLMLEPGNLLALTRLGSAHYALGSVQKAMEVWDIAIKIDPNNPEVEQIKSFMQSFSAEGNSPQATPK